MRAPEWWWTQQPSGPRPPALVWPVLLAVEACYGQLVRLRNAFYDRRLRVGRLFQSPIPTISLGNLTVGGSGKTPLAIWLAHDLVARGLRPAIIARGYGAVPAGLNDEMLLAARRCPQAVVLANPDRAAALREATATHAADVAVLDDAFQHRRVRRDLDVVLIDASRGLGNGHMLPAGPLREPAESLSRADLVLLTRAEQVDAARLQGLAEQIVSLAGRPVPVGRIEFEPAGLVDLNLGPAQAPGGPAGAFAGIGNFGSFVTSCRRMGIDVAGSMCLSDHCRYDPALCRRIAQWALKNRLAWLVTTEKDAVKVSQIACDWPVPVRVLAIRVVPDERTQAMLGTAVEAALARRAFGAA